MKTNILEKQVNNSLTTNNVNELKEVYSDFIKSLNEYINKENYIEDNQIINKYKINNNIVDNFDSLKLKESGICNIRRFKRYLRHAKNTYSLYTINKLLYLVHKRILKLDYSPKIVCEKHEKIQKLRKEWLKQQEIANNLLINYKKEKGNFYKN